MRLNAPLKPALALGAQRVVVIGLNSSLTPAQAPMRPDAIDGAAQLLQVALGRRDAEGWLEAQHDEGLWQIGRLPAGTTGQVHARSRPRTQRPRTSRA